MAHLQGVVVPGERLVLIEADGTRWKLEAGPDQRVLEQLEDCTLEVDGNRVGRRVVVRDWSVLAAADGSAPYLGQLRVHGNNLVLDDRNSGSTIVLEQADQLREHEGKQVLVIGYVAAPHVVVVMGWKILD
ncbi:MAG TPA: hypothetical protein QGF58_04320 [Myxococcota bacterium]|nr:hypothetical protein [Myxococcota bacterium]